MSFIQFFLVFIFFFGVSIGSSFLVLRVLHQANFRTQNFLNKQVITSSGLIFLFFLFFYGTYLLFFETSLKLAGWPYSLLIIGFGMGVLGFIDDLFGDHETSGFIGHFGALAKGKVTTGFLKAVFGFVLAIAAAFLASSGIISIIVNSFILALCVNFFNLLDLRPGRSIKSFLVAIILIFTFSRVAGLMLTSLPVLAPVLVVLYLDLKMQAMLGDTGSNFLGGIIGLYVIYSFGLKANLAILLGLIIVHLYSEKHSISMFISNNKFLSWFDNLGLKKSEVKS
jgi:UDP-N-acetylmuramyl pentapeptide phosphotransferase/UDP-N-acetylglucosamine-1-phosphate transferase